MTLLCEVRCVVASRLMKEDEEMVSFEDRGARNGGL